jgi:hypothetical protein
MNSLQNLANQRSNISVSSSSKEKLQSQTKPQGHFATVIASAATPSWGTALILMAVGCQRNGRRTLGHLHKKETQELPSKDSHSTVKEAACQVTAMVGAEAHTHSDLYIACIMTVRLTIT